MPQPALPEQMGTLAPPTPPDIYPRIRTLNDRLSLPLGYRLTLACTIGSVSGFMLGVAKGSQDCGLRFRAENAHRLPSTQTGWYLYHKSKNYNVMLGGIVEGMKQSIRYSLWVGMYFLVEEGVDRGRAAGSRLWRRIVDGDYSKRSRAVDIVINADISSELEERQVLGNRDCLSSMLAGLGTAGVFSAWNRFPLPTAARTAKMGAKAGLAFGLLQDGLSLLRGRRVGYLESLKRQLIGSGDNEHLAGETVHGT